MSQKITRRHALAGLAALPALAAPALARAQGLGPLDRPATGAKRNISSFITRDWRDHFDALGVGAIVCDVDSRALSFWKPDGTFRIYPSSRTKVPGV